MSKITDKLKDAPKSVLLMLCLGVLLLLVVFVYKFAFAKNDDTTKSASETENVVFDFPDAATDDKDESKLEALRRGDSGNITPDQYWESLDSKTGEASGGLTVSSEKKTEGYTGEPLDPNEYSEMEIYYIQKGLWKKSDVDNRHAENKRAKEEAQRKRQKPMTQEQKDSAYFARIEKMYALAQKYTDSENPEVAKPEDEVPSQEEYKHIDVESQDISLPSTTLAQENIITSLDTPVSVDGQPVEFHETLSPAKATFLKSETLLPGQRVVMRLMQDLHLSDGTVIPTNTHIKGICEVTQRLKIKVTTINYGGKIYYTNLDIYDSDGTEGIYCPSVVTSKAGKSAANIGKTAVSDVASLASTVMSSNPLLGRVAGSTIREISQQIDLNGNVSVNVSSGYEFFVFENLEANEKDNRKR